MLIPTFNRAAKLAACVASLARQTTAARFEVVVGLDGPDSEGHDAAERAWRESGGPAGGLRVIECQRAGYTIVRNRLVAEARGRVILSLNDDVVADPALVEAHWREHERRRVENMGPAIVVGDAPYALRPPGQPDSMLDRIVRETSMVFFYDVMNTPEGLRDREKDWGFRHCFGLNFSAQTALVREAGGFLALPHVYGYDDIELGWKLARRFNTPVIYRPEARVVHDHFYTASSLIEREFALGQAAWAFAAVNPEFARAVFGRDIRSSAEVARAGECLETQRDQASAARKVLNKLEQIPSSAPGPSVREWYERVLPAKRWEWRRGLLTAADEV